MMCRVFRVLCKVSFVLELCKPNCHSVYYILYYVYIEHPVVLINSKFFCLRTFMNYGLV